MHTGPGRLPGRQQGCIGCVPGTRAWAFRLPPGDGAMLVAGTFIMHLISSGGQAITSPKPVPQARWRPGITITVPGRSAAMNWEKADIGL